ncbi:glycosyl transferase group 1 [Calditerrivibrio nitroreducens DSM 19672]|uniref:Glycosyl transferase group 1 n=2 Tax=Calditerrivibrio nitroreducens TaxID=477976 RepID=E4TIN3_CALNY|nr:glycosyl transferase group 1 [Calditerrivibrio nitroreducens DSM 19672]
MKILCIDFRMHRSSGIGTFITNIVPFLINRYDIILMGKIDEIEKYYWSKSVKIINCISKIYSIGEQYELFYKIPESDIFWSPHYNIPILPIRSKKRVVTIHDVFHLAFYGTLSLSQKIYSKFFLSQAISRSDLIITVSKFSKQEIRKYIPTSKNIEIIYNAVDINTFKPIGDIELIDKIILKYNLPKNFILFVGNVKPHKNLKNLLLAIKKLDINLVVVGKKEGFITGDKTINDLINNNDLKNKVFFTGYVENEDLPVIYNLANLFVFPSLYEGFGIPPLEAQACGCPVICSNIASLSEVCGNSVIYFNPYDVDEMKEKIELVLRDENLQNELQTKGFENVKRFSWEESAKKIIKIFERLNP